jgi:tetratricopeptide (TPR) repeat protein
MRPRVRVWIVVGVAALAAAGAAVGVTLATRSHVEAKRVRPPALDFNIDPTAPVGLRREVKRAFDAWPAGTVRRLRVLGGRHPASAFVRLELGVALELLARHSDAVAAWREAERVQPDSPSAVDAQDLRFPKTPRGLPPFVPSFTRAHSPVERFLLRGALLQQELRPVSAEREFVAAARAAPNNPEALTAAAVGLYDKDRPALAFSRLGPLSRRFPQSQTVRFHLGLLLIYFGDVPRARRELALAHAEGPRTRLGKRAETLLEAGRKH